MTWFRPDLAPFHATTSLVITVLVVPPEAHLLMPYVALLAALFTAKIHNLLSHTTSNPKDTSNKRSLRLLVQHRARHLKYWRRTRGEDAYEALLADLGLERGAVEGELRITF